jgi:hypothetical protein
MAKRITKKNKKMMNKKMNTMMNMKMNKKTKSKSSRKSRKSSKSKVMKGGDDGRFVLPPSYFGGKQNGYYAEGSPELSNSTGEHAVSQGVIWGTGQYAGPNLYPKMSGGDCGCSGKRNKNSKSRKSKSRKL